MENIIILSVVAVIIILASLYIYRAKKKGKKCIGCPDGCSACSVQGNNTQCPSCCNK